MNYFIISAVVSLFLCPKIFQHRLDLTEFEPKQYQASNRVSYFIEKILDRKTTLYTQGLAFVNKSFLIESSGLYSKSRLSYFNITSGLYQKSVELSKKIFAEGISIVKSKKNKCLFYVLTWMEKQVLVYDDQLNYVKTL